LKTTKARDAENTAKLAQLSARIRIEESILRSLRTERAELVELHGQKLTARFGHRRLSWNSYIGMMCGFGVRSRTSSSKPSLRGTTPWNKIG
jgi:3-dehydroquinate dehydratase